jgi:hypothetical protein
MLLPNTALKISFSIVLIVSIARIPLGERGFRGGDTPFRNRQVMGSTPIVGSRRKKRIANGLWSEVAWSARIDATVLSHF